MSSLDEELEANQAEEEEKHRQEFEAQQQQDRLEQQQQEQEEQQSPQDQAAQYAKNLAKNQVKNWVKDQVLEKGGWEIILATSPYWGTALLIFAGIALVLFVVLTPVAICKSSYFDGLKVGGAKAALTASGFCSAFNGGTSGGAGASAAFPKELDIVLTSAYRPGAVVDNNINRPSAHGRGEAFDVALRNPTIGFNPNPPDPRIQAVISIAQSLGFTSPKGDIIDEYNNRSPGTQGPHIHIEFNQGQCGNTPATNPPTDLESLTGLVPMSGGVSDARVRACLKPLVLRLFEEVTARATAPTE